MRHRARAVGVVACLLLVSGCGTRLPHDRMVAGTGGPPVVALSPDSIDALKATHSQSASAPSAATSFVVGSTAIGSAVAPSARITASVPARPGKQTVASSGVAAGQAVGAAPATCAGPHSPIAIGQVGTFSGVAGPLTSSSRALMAAWAADLNARGGLACHPVEVYTQDDGADSSRAAAEVHDLVARHHVVAFVGNEAAFSINGFRPAVEAAKVPAVGGGGAGLKDDFESPYLFPTGSSADDLVVGLIGNAVAAGHTKLGLLYCVEVNACTQVFQFARDHAAKEAGAQLVYSAPVSVVQSDYTAQCLNARNAGVEVLGLALDGASMIRLGRSCAAIGYKPLLASSAALITPEQAKDPTLRSFGLASATISVPWMFTDQPGLQEYHRVFNTYASSVPPDGGSIMTWAAATMFEHAIANLGAAARTGPITPAMVMQGLGLIRHDTLGGVSGPVTFAPNQAHATSNGCVFYMTLGTTGWSAPRGTKPVCR